MIEWELFKRGVQVTLFLSVFSPAIAFGTTLVIDPGHGGNDQGAVSHFDNGRSKRPVYEKDLTLQIAKKLKESLTKLPHPFKVYMTRDADEYVSLESRGTLARKVNADLFISIHCNSHKKTQFSGIETYILNNATDEASRQLQEVENAVDGVKTNLDWILSDLIISANVKESVGLAKSIQHHLVRGLKSWGIDVKDRGIKQALFSVLMYSRTPGVLLETGFISNPRELGFLTQSRYQNLMADSIRDAILRSTPTSSKSSKEHASL